jgi:zinc protease
MEQLYGEHPWGRPRQGSRASLEAVEPGACAAFHRDSLARGVIVSVAGDIDEAAVRDLLVRRLSDLDREPVEAPTPPAPPPRIATSRRIALPQADQAQVLLGHLTVPVTDPDFVALELASVLLGSGPGLVGRIPERIRERDGLAYAASVSATSGAGSAPGRLVVHAGTAPERAPRLIEAVRDELGRLIEGGLRDEELDEARRYILGSDPFRRETARQLVALMAQAALFGIPLDDAGWLARAIGELDRPAVEAVLRAHLDPDRLAVTVGLPASR